MENNQIQVINFEDYAMSAETIQRQVNIVQHVMKQVMQEGTHYGTVPGCGTKPTLLKPGAEKLSVTFRLAPSYEIRKTDLPGGHREYEITCTLTHMSSGIIVGQGVGACSTMEGKYRFRKAGQKCPECGKEDTIIKGKQEYGGGWLCYVKKGGCGAKFTDGDERIENQEMGRIEHDNPADYFNTVLKMGKKRAHVDAVLTATGASDIFTQDIEDMPEVIPGVSSKPAQKEQPKKKSSKSLKRQMADALIAEGLTDAEMAEMAMWLKSMDEKNVLSTDTMLEVAKKTKAYINEWREYMEKLNASQKSEDQDSWMHDTDVS